MTDVLVLLVAAGFALMGLGALVRPRMVLDQFGVDVGTADGRNEVRAVYGGFGVAVAAAARRRGAGRFGQRRRHADRGRRGARRDGGRTPHRRGSRAALRRLPGVGLLRDRGRRRSGAAGGGLMRGDGALAGLAAGRIGLGLSARAARPHRAAVRRGLRGQPRARLHDAHLRRTCVRARQRLPAQRRRRAAAVAAAGVRLRRLGHAGRDRRSAARRGTAQQRAAAVALTGSYMLVGGTRVARDIAAARERG